MDITPIIEEFIPEQEKKPILYEEIRRNIKSSNAVFLFLTDNIMMTEHTKNWVIFEDGVAAASGKQLLLFEREGVPLTYPVPYLTDYMIFDKKSIEDLLKIQSIARKLKGYFSVEETEPPGSFLSEPGYILVWGIFTLFKVKRKRKTLKNLKILRVKCQKCNISFYYHSPKHSPFKCPACKGEEIFVRVLNS